MSLPEGAPLPAAARRLRLPLWDLGQSRMRERYGWDLSAPDAVERARRAVAERPQGAAEQLLLASALSTTGDADGAMAAARRAVELDPASARAETTLAAILVSTGDAAGALHHARRAANLDGGDPQVLFNLGLAERAAGEPRAARDAFIRAGAAAGLDVRPWWSRWRRRAPGPGSVA